MRLHGPDEPVYTIGVVARLLEISPQTLRQFEREGLVAPSRTDNNMRLYSQNELVVLRRICELVKVEGVNIAGVRAVMRVERRFEMVTHYQVSDPARYDPGATQGPGRESTDAPEGSGEPGDAGDSGAKGGGPRTKQHPS